MDLKRLSKVYVDTFLVHQIEYDSHLKMISLETFSKDYFVRPDISYWRYSSDLMEFEYQDGKLNKVTHKFGYDLLEYNSDNLLSHVTLYSKDGTTRGEYQYQYDSMRRLSSFDGITFEYDGENVSQYRHDTYYSGEHIYTSKYDDMKNPYDVFDAYFLTLHTEQLDIPSILSSNNVTNTIEYEYGGDSLYVEVDYQYKYDSEGYPVWKLSSHQYHDTVFYEYDDF